MARRRTRSQIAKEIKGKGKATVVELDEDCMISETPPPKDPSPATVSPQKVQSSDTKSTPKKKRNVKRVSKRSLEKEASASSPKPSSDHASPNTPSKKSRRSSPQVLKKSPHLPSSWLNNVDLLVKWNDEYASKALGFCDLVDMKMLDEMHLPCIEKFKKTTCMKLLNPGTISYPRLTRLFYLNLQANHTTEEVKLESLVAGKKITITKDLLVKILQCDPTCVSEPYPYRDHCLSLAKQQFLLPTSSGSRQLTHTSLKMEAKIIFTLLVRCVIPRDHSRELLTDTLLEMIWLIMNDYIMDAPGLIMEHMLRAISSSRNRSLPYANFLPKIFEEFNIPLDNEEIQKHGSTINEKTLHRLDIVKTDAGIWKLAQDLSTEDIAARPDLKSKVKSQKAPVPNHLETRVVTLEWELEEMREQVINMINKYNGLNDRYGQLQNLFEQIVEHQEKINEMNARAGQSNPPQGAEDKDADITEVSIAPSKLSSLASLASKILTSAIEDALGFEKVPAVAEQEVPDIEAQVTPEVADKDDAVPIVTENVVAEKVDADKVEDNVADDDADAKDPSSSSSKPNP